MRVPVRRQPETRVSEQQQAFARPVQPLDTSPLTDVIEGFRDQLLSEQDARQRVDLNRRLIEEVNSLQEDFAARQRNPEESPIDFAARTHTAYTERHMTLVEQLRQEGYTGDLLDDFDTRLGNVRQSFYERGLGHQLQQLDVRAAETVEATGTAASQMVAADPSNFTAAQELLDETIRTSPDLTEARREQLRDQYMAVLRGAGMQALGRRDPRAVITALDPQGLMAPGRTAPTPTATAPASVPTGAVAADSPYNTVLGNGRFGTPPRPITEMTLGEVYDFGRSTLIPRSRAAGVGRDSRGPVGSSAVGAYQITGSTLTDIAPTVLGANWREQRFTPEVQDRLAEHLFNLSRGSVSAMRNRWEGLRSLSTAEVERIRQLPWPEARTAIARVESSASPEQLANVAPVRAGASATGASQLTNEVQNVEVPASTSEPGVTVPAQEPTNPLESIRTGNPLIDSLNGLERMELLRIAYEQQTRMTAAGRAEMDVTIENVIAERMNGENGTPLPAEADVVRIYGPVEGPQRMARLRAADAARPAIVSFRTQSAADIERTLASLRPTPGSPTYATQLQIYEPVARAAQALLTERQQDAAGYVMRHFPAVREAAQRGSNYYYAALDRAYEALGIDPETAPLMTAAARTELIAQYRTMSPPQRAQFMMENWTMGESRFRRFVNGLEGTTAETDARIFALLRHYPRNTGITLYQEILEGRETIARDPARRPQAAQVTALFREHGLNAITSLNADASSAIQEAAEGIYVQRGGNPTNLDTNLYRQALAAALGGSLPVAMGTGQAAQYHTILPPGTNRQQFEAWVERQTMESLSARSVERRPPRYGDLRTPVPEQDIIDHGTFVMVSPNQYMIRMSTDGRPLMTSTGNPFIVTIYRQDLVGGVGRTRAPVRNITLPQVRGVGR